MRFGNSLEITGNGGSWHFPKVSISESIYQFTNEIYEIVSEVFSKDLKLVEGAKDYISKSDRNHYIGSNSNKDRILEGLKIVGLDKLQIPFGRSKSL